MAHYEVALVESMVGHTIVAAKFYDEYPGNWWSGEVAELTLGDGRTIQFGSVGGDVSAVTVNDITNDA